MALTVREILKIDIFSNVKLVAGTAGLDNVVRIANIIETPEVAQWMKGGELLITGGYIFKDSPELRRDLIYQLVEKGVAALGVRLGKYLLNVPEDMIKYADEVGLPLLELPADVAYMDMMLPILESVINNQYASLKKSEKTHHALLNVVLAGEGIAGIGQVLAHQLVGEPVFVVNNLGNLLTSAIPKDKAEDYSGERSQKLLKYFKKQGKKFHDLQPHRGHRFDLIADDDVYKLIITPVEVGRKINGYLIIDESNRFLDEQDLIAIENASTILALELMKSKAMFEAEKQVRSEFLDYLIHGRLNNAEAVVRRASYLNFDLSSDNIIFYITIDSFEEQLLQDDEDAADNMDVFKGRVFQAVNNTFLKYPGGILMMIKSNCLVGMINLDKEDADSLKALKRRLYDLLVHINIKMEKKLTVSIGVGKIFNSVYAARSSYEDARQACRIGYFLHGPAQLTFFGDLGAYVVLHELKNSKAAFDFYETTIGKVIQYDRQNDSELFRTLAYYFKYDCNTRLTAENLYVHKNTVAYRLRAIENLTGLNLNNGEDKFNLQLCVKLAQVELNKDYKNNINMGI